MKTKNVKIFAVSRQNKIKRKSIARLAASVVVLAGVVFGAQTVWQRPAEADPPTMIITSISPATGSTAGGETVTIHGAGFTTTAPVPTTLQEMSQEYCTNGMTVYDGTSPTALLSLPDTRGGSYTIGKLADENCWMLDNLRLGSTTGTTLLTPDDTNIQSDFTLPQLTTTGAYSYNAPAVYAPVPGDGTGAANYGYLYNWCAATAGDPAATQYSPSHTCTGSSTQPDPANQDICPANWRLPSSYDFSWLDQAFGGTGTYAVNGASLPNWLNGGAFRGVFSGYYNGSFSYQGSLGYYWSSSTDPGGAAGAGDLYFGASSVRPDGTASRYYGFAVRCMAPGGTSQTQEPSVFFGIRQATVVSYANTEIVVTAPAGPYGPTEVVLKSWASLSAETISTPATPGANVYTYDRTSSYINLSVDNADLLIDSVPTTSGAVATASHNVTVQTSHDSGYHLTVSTATDETAMKHTSIPGANIAATAGTLATPGTLGTNRWGMSLVAGQWFGVPGVSSPLTIKTTSAPTPAGDVTNVNYGAKIDTMTLAGEYRTTVVYTAVTNAVPAPTTMQNMTQNYCWNYMTTYDGTNPAAILVLEDIRNGQNYQVARLADGNCWMLNNLRIDNYLATSADSDVEDDYQISEVGVIVGTVQDDSVVVDLTDGNTLGDNTPGNYAGADFYGYGYNTYTSTAGSVADAYSYNTAQHSICPSGWQMPVTVGNSDTAGYAQLRQIWGYYEADKWNYSGPFRGVLSGYGYIGYGGYDPGTGNSWYYVNLYQQGDRGYLSGREYSGNQGLWSFRISLNDTSADLQQSGAAYAVRCLLR